MYCSRVPGVAKTLLVRVRAALHLQTRRMQFTPDLMPSDVTGSLIFDARRRPSSSARGRCSPTSSWPTRSTDPPKTQASLLEVMEEQVSVDGRPRPLPEPFLVAATQNPIEYEGTYLPEAQLDRFLFKLTVPLPTATRNWA